MLKKLTCSVVILVMLSVCVRADTGVIQVSGEHTYKAVRLTPEIYNRSKRNLSDVLITDETGTAVPYFINSFETAQTDMAASVFPLVLADAFVKNRDSYTDYFAEGAVENEDRDILATSITVQTPSSMFAKNVELRGSFDGINWDFIQNDRLYSVDGNEKKTIVFQKPLKYAYYRFKILDNAENISFDGAFLEYSQNTVEQVFFTETLTPEFQTEEADKTTVIKLSGLKNVKINEITLETENQFKRTVYFASGRTKELYNLSFDNAFYCDTTLPFDGYSETDDILEVRIYNGDDAPVKISGVTVTYFADEIIFKGQNDKSYTLSFANETVSNAPVYDIVNYKDLILREGYDVLAIDNITVSEAIPEPEKIDYSTAFNIVVVIVSLLLGFVILLRLKRSHTS